MLNFHFFCGTPCECQNEDGDTFFGFQIDDNQQLANWSDWPDDISKLFRGCLSVRITRRCEIINHFWPR